MSRCFIVYLPFLAHDVFLILFGLFMLGGDTLLSMFLVSLLIDLYL